MPNEEAHIRLANRNQAVIDSLLPRVDEFSEWVTTTAFYKALHVIDRTHPMIDLGARS